MINRTSSYRSTRFDFLSKSYSDRQSFTSEGSVCHS